MDEIKVEIEDFPLPDQDCLNSENCFICLQPVTQFNLEQFNSLNIFFDYLKISERDNLFVCEKCEEKLTKFAKLLEKVRLEMDYLLRFVQLSISNSNQDLGQASVGFLSARESVVKKCQERIHNQKPEIILQRIPHQLIKQRSHFTTPECSEDLTPNLNNDDPNLRNSQDNSGSPSPDVEANDFEIKQENVEEAPTLDSFIHSDEEKGDSSANGKIKCPNCPKLFSQNVSLNRHIKIVHLRLKPYKCPNCEKSFSLRQNLNQHIDAVHLRLKPFQCSTCFKTFAEKSTLCQHFNAIHLHLKAFKCDLCERTFPRAQTLRRHKAKYCKGKAKIPKPAGPVDNHEESTQKKTRFRCKICKKKFQKRHNLDKHISACHKHPEQSFHCEVSGCGKIFYNSKALDVHYRLRHPDFIPLQKEVEEPLRDDELEKGNSLKTNMSRFLCVKCGYSTNSNYHFETHVKLIHKRSVEEYGKSGSDAMNNDMEYILP